MDLFDKEDVFIEKDIPLAKRMCPCSFDDFFGQEHIVGKGKLLRRAIEIDRLSSVIFYGAPGVGKTALAMIISKYTNSYFINKNAVTSNVLDIRKVIDEAKKLKQLNGKKTVLLLDEIHRFNKAQQDVLLPELEQNSIVLIGTTTENPFFSVNAALLSRSQIFEFKVLTEKDICSIVNRAIKDKEKGFGHKKIIISKENIFYLAKLANGDARKALNALEIAVLTTKLDKETGVINLNLQDIEESIQKKVVRYDKKADEHYDTISAYIKSMRGSDPDAAIYWLAKMIVAGEDLKFIARRLLICASEDVGNADPNAIVIVNAAIEAAIFVGFPEAKIPLAQATIYVACAKKSNASYEAIEKALVDIKNDVIQEVPDGLKDAHYYGAKQLGRGKGYKYSHSYENHYVEQKYMYKKKQYYVPTEIGYEKKIKEWLKMLKSFSMKNNIKEKE